MRRGAELEPGGGALVKTTRARPSAYVYSVRVVCAATQLTRDGASPDAATRVTRHRFRRRAVATVRPRQCAAMRHR